MTTTAGATTQAVSIDQFLSALFPEGGERINIRAFYAKKP
jgi:hypothetical protein